MNEMSSTNMALYEKESANKDADTMDSKISKPGGHDYCRGGLIIFTTVTVFVVITISYLSSSDDGIAAGLFVNKTGDVSDFFYLEITPANWTFTIWAFIFVWQIVWLVYCIANIFRRNSIGEHVYLSPQTEPPVFYFIYLFNLGVTLAWVFMFDRKLIGWSFLPIVLALFALYSCIAISINRLAKHGDYMMEIGMNKDIWMKRLFIHNGLAIYATWVTIATLLNLAMLLTYRADVDQSTSSAVSLFVLTVKVVAWFVIDVFVSDKYTRYLFTPYIVVNVALAGSLAKNFKQDQTNSVISLCLLAVALGATIIKVIMMFYRHKTRPLFSYSVEKENVVMA